jgi:hypothetical protein
LRKLLPQGQYLITHAPGAPYFTGASNYKNGGYRAVHKAVGSLIDWYNIQFYNQGINSYDSYDLLFSVSGNWFIETAVDELIKFGGIPHQKIVIGKPATAADLLGTGLVDPVNLGKWGNQYFQLTGVCFGIMTWQFIHDDTGSIPTKYMQQFTPAIVCDTSCKTCSGSLSTQCLTCSGSLKFDATSGTCCPNFYDAVNSKCGICDNSCLTCSAASATSCLTC